MSTAPGWVVIGGGGHAKTMVGTLLELGAEIAAILDDDPQRWDERLLGVPISGPIAGHPPGGPAVIAIGDNSVRRRLSAELDYDWQRLVHPTAFVHPTARLAEGVMVAAGAVIQPDAVIGAHAIVNTGATIDHDCVVGRYSHVAPGAHLAGDVELGEGVFIGLGAGVTPGVSLGDWAILGAGAIAARDLPARTTAVGVPARVRDDG